jgi:hypothetical protein
MPAVIFPLELQVEFYRLFLILSLVSMTSVSVESLATMRFPRRRSQGFRLYGYVSLILISSILVLGCYGLVLRFFYPDLFLIIFCGVAFNFKLLYTSWLRVDRPDKLIKFLIVDGLVVLLGCCFLFFVESSETLLALILTTKLCAFVLFATYDIASPKSIWHRLSKVKFIHLKYLLLASIIVFISSLFIVHQATFLKLVSLKLLDDRGFVAMSVALSIGANIQKVLLSYYWVIQKNIFATRISRVVIIRELKLLPALVSIGVFSLWLALELLNLFDFEAKFGMEIIVCVSILMIHRLASASVRLMTISMYGVKAQFFRQLGSIFIIAPSIGLLFALDIASFMLVLGVALGCEFVFVYVIPMVRGWRELDQRRGFRGAQ